MLCLENGLSVIAEPKPSRGSYGTWMGDDKPPTVRGQLEQVIDTALGQGCKDFDSFLAAMKTAGVEVMAGPSGPGGLFPTSGGQAGGWHGTEL